MKNTLTVCAMILAVMGTFVGTLALTAPPKEQIIYVRATAPAIDPAEVAAFAAKQEAAREARIQAELDAAAAIDATAYQQLATLKETIAAETEAPQAKRKFPTNFEFEQHDTKRYFREREQKLDKAITKFEESLEQ